MRKSTKLFLLSFTLGTFPLAAQTEQNPLDIALGENYYTIPYFVEWESGAYFKYSNDSNEDVILTFEGDTFEDPYCYISATMDEEYLYGGETLDGKIIYAIPSGRTLLMEIYPTTPDISFITTKIIGIPIEGGETIHNSINVKLGEVYVPYFYNADTYLVSPTYLKYEVVSPDLLKFEHAGYSVFAYSVNGKPFKSLTSQNNSSGLSSYMIPAEETGEYIFEITPNNPLLAEFTVTSQENGRVPETAFDAEDSSELPEGEGIWWWKITPDKSGFLIMNSNVDLGTGGYSLVRDALNDDVNEQRVEGAVAIRYPVTPGKTYYAAIYKGVTAKGKTVEFIIEDAKTGDSPEMPIVITAPGEFTSPTYNGTYYYKIETDLLQSGKYLYVEIQDENSYSNVTGYLTFNENTAVIYGGYGRIIVEPEGECRLTISIDKGINNIPFKLRCAEDEQGDTASNPLIAVSGENELMPGYEKYYIYTPSINEFIRIKVADPSVKIEICERSDNWLLQLGGFLEDGWLKLRISEVRSNELYIIFTDIHNSTTFALEEVPFKEGDVFEFPEEAVVGENIVPVSDSHYFIFYPETDGWLVVEKPEETFMTLYYLINPSGDWDAYFTASFDGKATPKGVKYEVCAGKPYILEFNMIYDSLSVILSMEEILPGEGQSTAFECGTGEIALPSDRDYIWYAFEVPYTGYLSLFTDIEWEDEYINGMWKSSKFGVQREGYDYLEELYDYEEGAYSGTLTVRKGERYLILVQTVSGLSGKTLAIEMEEPAELKEGTNLIETADSWYGYKWYTAEVSGPGEVSLKTDQITFDAELYLEDDFLSPVAYSEDINNSSSIIKYNVNKAGKLYFLITRLFYDTEATYHMEASDAGLDLNRKENVSYKVLNEGLYVSGEQLNVEIYNINGALVKNMKIDGEIYVPLSSGCYILKLDGKVIKIII